MKLDSKHLRLILLGALGISIVAFVSIVFLGLSTLDSKSRQMTELKVKSQTAEAQLANLEQAKKQVEKYSYFKEVAKSVIPNDKNQAEAILEINRIASLSGISLQSITFPASTLGLTTSLPQDATSSAASRTAISQAKPVSGIPGLYSLELTVTPEANSTAPADKQLSYAKMLDFLSRIENNRHTAQIAQVNITPEGAGTTAGKGFGFSLIINIFIKP